MFEEVYTVLYLTFCSHISAHHSGLQLHFSKAAVSMNKGIYYDTIFVLNTGRITSIGPHGEINWQVLENCYNIMFYFMTFLHRRILM